MRIAFHVPRAKFFETCPGGALRTSGDGMFIANLLTVLSERGHRVSIVSRLDVRDFWRGRLPARRLIAEAVLVRGDMKRFSPDAWLVYASSVEYPDLFGWWQRPKKYVLLGCEGWGDRKAQALRGPWRSLLTTSFRRSLLRADMITALRPSIARSLRRAGAPEGRVCVLPLAIKTWNHVPCREEAREVLGLPQQTPVILCVSRFSVRRHKDDSRPGKTEAILDLLAAVATLPSNALLLLVGDGPGRRQIEEEAARLRVAGRVQFAGQVEHSDVNWFYAASDFFAYPDNAESNRPYQAMLEAQACGRPVLAMQAHSAHSIVEPGRTGLLAKDLGEFQAHLSTLVQDRSRCEELGREGPAYVTRFFSIENRVRQIEALLLGGGEVPTGVPSSKMLSPQRRELLDAKSSMQLGSGAGADE